MNSHHDRIEALQKALAEEVREELQVIDDRDGRFRTINTGGHVPDRGRVNQYSQFQSVESEHVAPPTLHKSPPEVPRSTLVHTLLGMFVKRPCRDGEQVSGAAQIVAP